MRVDTRDMKGRAPRCEMGLCKTRSTVSVGDASSRGALGRVNLCDDCATQIKDLLKDRYEASEEVEVVEEVVEDPLVTPEEMTLAQLKEHATSLGIDFKAKVRKDELLVMIDLHG